jgi:dipeptidyl-peptidase-4
MTSYAMTHSDLFKVRDSRLCGLFAQSPTKHHCILFFMQVGVSGAPVTDWRLYDTIYTERYMGTPQNNPEGYDKASLLTAAAAQSLNGKLLLVHGSMDDNVHFQQSVQFIYQLQRANKHFDFMLYPKSRHGVVDPHLAQHLRTNITQHFDRHL